MLLSFADGKPFATGSIGYNYISAENDISSRIQLQIEIEGILTTAVVDTGAPYLICAPSIADMLQLEPAMAIEQLSLRIRGLSIDGNTYRMSVSFRADDGESLYVDATVFVPDLTEQPDWDNLPSFIGYMGCLERMCFAVDPTAETFFFGPAR